MVRFRSSALDSSITYSVPPVSKIVHGPSPQNAYDLEKLTKVGKAQQGSPAMLTTA